MPPASWTTTTPGHGPSSEGVARYAGTCPRALETFASAITSPQRSGPAGASICRRVHFLPSPGLVIRSSDQPAFATARMQVNWRGENPAKGYWERSDGLDRTPEGQSLSFVKPDYRNTQGISCERFESRPKRSARRQHR